MRTIALALRATFLLLAMLSVVACGSSSGTGPDGDATTGGGGGVLSDTVSSTGDAGAGDNAVCVPQCAGRVCGDDGCGGSCGTCSGGQVCNLGGLCTEAVNCTDTCEGAEAACGVVCGVGCGVCAADAYCAGYQCLPRATDPGPEPDASGSTDTTTPPPAPVCGDGTCNGNESCLTCTADCGECVEETKYYCFEMSACVTEGCPSTMPMDELQACYQANMATCSSAGQTPQEYSNWYDWQVCLSTCTGQSPSPEQRENCFQFGCPAEVAECFSGGTYGDANCAEIDACLNDTCLTVPAAEQSACMRDCFATGTEDGIAQQTAILFCMSTACAEETTPQGQQACLQAAMAPDGVCGDAVSICMGGAAECDPACGDGETCVDGVCVADGPSPCDPACAEGETCVDGECVAPQAADKCLNDDDLAAIGATNMSELAGGSALGCLETAGLAGLGGCVLEALTTAGLSDDCGGCYVDTVLCAAANCMADCGADPASDACVACQTENCGTDFYMCSGFAPGCDNGICEAGEDETSCPGDCTDSE